MKVLTYQGKRSEPYGDAPLPWDVSGEVLEGLARMHVCHLCQVCATGNGACGTGFCLGYQGMRPLCHMCHEIMTFL